jgi:hypothetical protein
VNVDPGDSIVLAQLGLPDLGLFGPDRNAHLETPALVKLGFTGINPWDRTKVAKLADGTWRYQYEDVTTATNIPVEKLEGVRSWIDAPYHRLPLLDANTRQAGPYGIQLGTTLGLGEAGWVRVPLDPAIPAGPWKATISLRSGPVQRAAAATVTFLAQPGSVAAAVPATSEAGAVERTSLAMGVGLLVLGGLLLLRRRGWAAGRGRGRGARG